MDIGYGLCLIYLLEKVVKNLGFDVFELMSFEDYKVFVVEYMLEKIVEMIGVLKDQLE